MYEQHIAYRIPSIIVSIVSLPDNCSVFSEHVATNRGGLRTLLIKYKCCTCERLQFQLVLK